MAATYLDSSAIVKLVIEEPESAVLRRYLRRRPLVASALATTEVMRAVLPQGEQAVGRARAVLAKVDLVRVGERVLSSAGTLLPAELSSLDAIHLATAQLLGSDLGVVITYDERMIAAARELGLKTRSPGS